MRLTPFASLVELFARSPVTKCSSRTFDADPPSIGIIKIDRDWILPSAPGGDGDEIGLYIYIYTRTHVSARVHCRMRDYYALRKGRVSLSLSREGETRGNARDTELVFPNRVQRGPLSSYPDLDPPSRTVTHICIYGVRFVTA